MYPTVDLAAAEGNKAITQKASGSFVFKASTTFLLPLYFNNKIICVLTKNF